jgi:subtilisin family serine protease
VRYRFDTLVNAISVDLDDAQIARLRQLDSVAAIHPVLEMRLHMDRAVNVHRIRDVWRTVTGGQAGAGAGIKIGIIDSGIDIAHPAFQGFAATPPSGYPKFSTGKEGFTNNKVIVARDYVGDARTDPNGHGTAVAMVAAGGIYDAQVNGLAPFSGVAPGAWLGNYRVTDSDGRSSSDLFLRALEDAVTDGMNIVNYSSGGPLLDSNQEENGVQARAIRAAVNAGIVFFGSAGNNGPDRGTISMPSSSPAAISVGANINERIFDQAVVLGALAVAAQPASNSDRTDRIRGAMVDVAMLDNNGFGCAEFPAASLKGKIALISRGGPDGAACAFDMKAFNAETAGAVAVVVYNNAAASALISMSIPTATVPAMFIRQSDGIEMKRMLAEAPDTEGLVDFEGSTPLPFDSDGIWVFSSEGPTAGGGMKPDLVATGAAVASAYTTVDEQPPYVVLASGTSFSAPLAAGAAAVLMSARPGLTGPQYASLLVNSAPRLNWPSGLPVGPAVAGSGKLDMVRSLQGTAAAEPTSLQFKGVSGTFDVSKSLVVTNVGAETDTFTVAARAIDETGTVPTVDAESFTLARGASRTLQVKLTATDAAAGEVHGVLEIAGTKGGAPARVPYWLGVRGTPKSISTLQSVDLTTQSFGAEVPVLFRVLDAAGLPVDAGTPEITTTALRATVTDIVAVGNVPGTFRALLRMGRADENGLNIFTITAGGATRDLFFVIR